MKITISLVNDDTKAKVVLEQTDRNVLIVGHGIVFSSGSYDYQEDIEDWISEDGFIHYRIVIKADSVAKLVDDVMTTDVKLLVNGQVIRANKYVLMVHSDVFQAIFDLWDEEDGDEIEINDVEYEPMLAMVQAMYSGSIEFTNVEFALKV